MHRLVTSGDDICPKDLGYGDGTTRYADNLAAGVGAYVRREQQFFVRNNFSMTFKCDGSSGIGARTIWLPPPGVQLMVRNIIIEAGAGVTTATTNAGLFRATVVLCNSLLVPDYDFSRIDIPSADWNVAGGFYPIDDRCGSMINGAGSKGTVLDVGGDCSRFVGTASAGYSMLFPVNTFASAQTNDRFAVLATVTGGDAGGLTQTLGFTVYLEGSFLL